MKAILNSQKNIALFSLLFALFAIRFMIMPICSEINSVKSKTNRKKLEFHELQLLTQQKKNLMALNRSIKEKNRYFPETSSLLSYTETLIDKLSLRRKIDKLEPKDNIATEQTITQTLLVSFSSIKLAEITDLIDLLNTSGYLLSVKKIDIKKDFQNNISASLIIQAVAKKK